MDSDDRTLHDERLITRQLLVYCRAMDRCDAALGYTVFHPDAQVDYGAMFRGSGHDFVDFAMASHRRFDSHLHLLGNVLIELAGIRAASETYVEAQFRLTEQGASFDMYTRGRYLDRWEDRGEGWAIAERRYVNAMSGKRAVADSPFGIEGSRDGADPSYAVLRSALPVVE